MRNPLPVLLLLACTPQRQSAQTSLFVAGEHRTITISGDGTVQAVPDMAEVELQVVTENADLLAAKRDNDLRIRRVEAIAGSYGLKPEDIRIEYDTIEREISHDPKNRLRQVSYSVKKRVRLQIRDLSRFETLLNDLLTAGINELQSVAFKNSRAEILEARARELAVKASRDKAAAMAAVLGQKVGKPLRIIESSDNGGADASGSEAGTSGTDQDSKETIVPETAAGILKFTARVSVVFELE